MPETCAFLIQPAWVGQPQVCHHTRVLQSGGICRDEVCRTLAAEDEARRLERARE